MRSCSLCGDRKYKVIHYGTRDNKDINVLKCEKCGLITLSSLSENTNEGYEQSRMRENTYNIITDSFVGLPWNEYVKITEPDDIRRYVALCNLCKGKKVLEFGCGNGGFLKRMKKVASEVVGIELSEECRIQLENEGILLVHDFSELNEKYDVIVMFMVLEHLNDPDLYLQQIYEHLSSDGIFVCETPNADDILLSKYECTEFADFTYWSEHVCLYTSKTIEMLLKRNNFSIVENSQIQRYTLANHLYWLANGKPGGHSIWQEFNDISINERYAQLLSKEKKCDTLWVVCKKH